MSHTLNSLKGFLGDYMEDYYRGYINEDTRSLDHSSYRGYIRDNDNGRENGNYYVGFRV